MAAVLMKQFPLEDQGMVLLFGPLPSGATSYPAEGVFEGPDLPTPDSENGHGLLFRVEARQVVVQFGNGQQRLDHERLRHYKLYATGIPCLPEKAIAGMRVPMFHRCILLAEHL